MKSPLYYIPGTRHFRVGHRHEIRNKTEKGVARFNLLQTLDHQTKERLSTHLRHHLYRLAEMQVIHKSVMYIVSVPITVLVLLFAVSGLFASKLWPNLDSLTIGTAPNFVLYLLSFSVAYIIAFWPFLSLGRTRRIRRGSTSALYKFLWVATITTLYAIILYRIILATKIKPPSTIIFLIAEGITGIIGTLVISIIATCILLITQAALKRRVHSLYPDSLLINGFLNILYLVEKESLLWTDLNFKRRLMVELEEVALCIQYDLPRNLRSNDAFTDIWIKERSRQMAASLRSLKQWILTPMWDTYGKFTSRISENFIQAVDGNWDKLERIEPPKLSQRQLYTRLRSMLIGIVLSVLPILGLLGIQQSQLRLDGALADYAKLVAIVWAVVSLLSTFDPTFNTKLSAVKDIAASLTPGGKGGD